MGNQSLGMNFQELTKQMWYVEWALFGIVDISGWDTEISPFSQLFDRWQFLNRYVQYSTLKCFGVTIILFKISMD